MRKCSNLPETFLGETPWRIGTSKVRLGEIACGLGLYNYLLGHHWWSSMLNPLTWYLSYHQDKSITCYTKSLYFLGIYQVTN